jgi:hypothetical protein
VRTLDPVGPAAFEVLPGGSAILEVCGEPGAPVSFHSYDMGAFENNRATISVQADAKGIARATFSAIAGTHGDVNILAASPLSAGQAYFLVTVSEPEAAEEN